MSNLVWYVADGEGGMPQLFDTKEAAEKWARMLFPDEPASRRYTRIYFRKVMTLEEVTES
jgi:hypothetical protein